GDARAGELATLALAAGERARACAHAARAAAHARAERDPRQSEARLRWALALWEPGAGEALRAGLLLDLGRLLVAVGDRPVAAPGDVRRASRELGAALRRARALGDAPAAAAALMELAVCRRFEPAAAAAHLEAALVLTRQHGLARMELRALWLRAAVHVDA